MEVIIKFRESDARSTDYFLRKYLGIDHTRHLGSSNMLGKVIKTLVTQAVAKQAALDLEEAKEQHRARMGETEKETQGK